MSKLVWKPRSKKDRKNEANERVLFNNSMRETNRLFMQGQRKDFEKESSLDMVFSERGRVTTNPNFYGK